MVFFDLREGLFALLCNLNALSAAYNDKHPVAQKNPDSMNKNIEGWSKFDKWLTYCPYKQSSKKTTPKRNVIGNLFFIPQNIAKTDKILNKTAHNDVSTEKGIPCGCEESKNSDPNKNR